MKQGSFLVHNSATMHFEFIKRFNVVVIYEHVQLGLLDKGRAIKGLVVCNDWDLEP